MNPSAAWSATTWCAGPAIRASACSPPGTHWWPTTPSSMPGAGGMPRCTSASPSRTASRTRGDRPASIRASSTTWCWAARAAWRSAMRRTWAGCRHCRGRRGWTTTPMATAAASSTNAPATRPREFRTPSRAGRRCRTGTRTAGRGRTSWMRPDACDRSLRSRARACRCPAWRTTSPAARAWASPESVPITWPMAYPRRRRRRARHPPPTGRRRLRSFQPGIRCRPMRARR